MAFEQAEQLYRQALDADARAVGALDGLGDVYFERADYKRSAKYREQAAKFGPSGGRYIDLGDALFKINRLTDARSAYQDAGKKGHPDASGRIGRVDRKLGG